MFEWFKPKNRRNVVVPTEIKDQLYGLELIKKFTTPEEPKVKDYPRTEYSVYWEIVLESIPGGYSATLSFYSYETSKLMYQKTFNDISVESLKDQVNKTILSVMKENKR